MLRCIVKDSPSNTLARCYNVTIYQLHADYNAALEGETRLRENAFHRKEDPLYCMFKDDYDKHIHTMNRIGYSFRASSSALYLNKIKPEKYRSLEERCIDLKKMFDTYYFEPLHFTVTEMVIDFIQNSNSQFVMLQVKDYQCQPIKYISKINVHEKEKESIRECEGAICKFAKQAQTDYLIDRLIWAGALSRNWCKKGKNIIRKSLISGYSEDYINY